MLFDRNWQKLASGLLAEIAHSITMHLRALGNLWHTLSNEEETELYKPIGFLLSRSQFHARGKS